MSDTHPQSILNADPSCHRCVIRGNLANSYSPVHEHPFYELATALKGGCTIYLGDREIQLEENHSFLLPPATTHNEKWPDQSPCRVAWVAFTLANEPPKEFRAWSEQPIDISSFARDIRINYERIRSEINNHSPEADLRIVLNLRELLILVHRCATPTEDFPLDQKLSPKQVRLVEAATEEMKNHLDQPLQISELAEMFYLSPAHFSTIFRAHHGMPPVKYLNNLRLERAAELLKTTQMPLADIAQATGFLDAAYFCKKFRKYYKRTPGQYRGTTSLEGTKRIKGDLW